MANEKLTVTWDDLQTEKVEEKIKRQEGLAIVQQQYKSAPAPEALLRHKKTSWLYNAAFYMSFFGLIGGLLGWGCGELLHFGPNLKMQARELIGQEEEIMTVFHRGDLTREESDATLEQVRHVGRNNPYFVVYNDPSLNDRQKEEETERIERQDQWKQFVANVLFYGACGMMISLCLGAAESIVERNTQAAIINASVGAMLGLFGGLLVSLFVDRIYQFALGSAMSGETSLSRQMLARAASWGVLGLFLSLAPGIVLRNLRRLAIGAAGGLIGGVIGGILFEPVARLTHDQMLSRLVGMVAIGLVGGLGTGLIENAAKSGWLRVTEGLIAGKQFVLYRNPTYLGSSPHCQIYLFKDKNIGRRHAAVHIIKGGFEIEDLPLGGPTHVNGKPVSRQRLHDRDEIQIGGTRFLFQERAHTV